MRELPQFMQYHIVTWADFIAFFLAIIVGAILGNLICRG